MASEPNSAVTMNVSLPEPLKRYVDGKVASGLYGSASEFVREVIREKLVRDEELERAREKLDALLLEGLNSGEPVRIKKGDLEKRKAKLLERLAKGKSAG